VTETFADGHPVVTADRHVSVPSYGSQPGQFGLGVFVGLLRALHVMRSRQAVRLIAEFRALDARYHNAPLLTLQTRRS